MVLKELRSINDMTKGNVQIKTLKGFINYVNGEHNTLSLLVKSNYQLNDHLQESRQKLILALTSIINHYKGAQLHFNHKLQVSLGNRYDYITTKAYALTQNMLKENLDNSFETAISICPNKFDSHFVNIAVKENNTLVKLSDGEFNKLNNVIRSSIKQLNDDLFVDNVPLEKPTKIEKERCLFVDDVPLENSTNNEKYLYVDDVPFEKAMRKIEKENARIKEQTKIINERFINALRQHIEYLTL